MLNFINLFLPLIAFIFLLFLPFNYLLNFKFSYKNSFLLSISFFSVFSFIIIFIYHLLSVWVLIFLYGLIFFSIFNDRNYQNQFKISNFLDIIIVTFFSLLLWFLLFYKNFSLGNIESDIMYQVGFVNELKQNLIPNSPHWFREQIINYHLLTHYSWAFLSLTTNVPSVIIVFFNSNLIICFSIVSIIYVIIGRKNSYLGFLILFIFIFYQYFEKYDYLIAVKKNMAGHNAGSFFWSLPLFIGSLFLYEKYDKYRVSSIKNGGAENKLNILLISFIFPVVIFYSKANFLLFFLFSEIFLIIVNLYTYRKNKDLILNFVYFYSPFFISFFIIFIFLPFDGSSWYGLAFSDFGGLHSLKFESFFGIYFSELVYENLDVYLFSLLKSIASIYLFTIIMIILFRSKLNQIILAFIFSSFGCYFYSLILNHPGNSDLYFVGNTLIINMVICQYLIKYHD